MPTFIALPNRSPAQRMRDTTLSIGVSVDTLSTEEKRELLRMINDEDFREPAATPQSILVDSLVDIGFEQIPSLDESSVGMSMMDQRSSKFMYLGYLDIFVFNSEYNQKIVDAKERFRELDYVVIPDVEFLLSKPTSSQNVFWSGDQVLLPEESGIHRAHNNGITGEGVFVGVLDTGCYTDHVELRQKQIDFCYVPRQFPGERSEPKRLQSVQGFDRNGHGTHVCGIVAGQNVGVAPDVDLAVAAAIEKDTFESNLARINIGLNWLLYKYSSGGNNSRPGIINMSWGIERECLNADQEQIVMDDLHEIIQTLFYFNMLLVCAIGNEGPCRMDSPGDYPETLSVGAVDFDYEPACFSGGGQTDDGKTEPDIAGYGVDVISCYKPNGNNESVYQSISGTSMAAPYVTGIAALYASADLGLQGETLRHRLLDTVLPLQAEEDRVGVGLARFI